MIKVFSSSQVLLQRLYSALEAIHHDSKAPGTAELYRQLAHSVKEIPQERAVIPREPQYPIQNPRRWSLTSLTAS